MKLCLPLWLKNKQTWTLQRHFGISLKRPTGILCLVENMFDTCLNQASHAQSWCDGAQCLNLHRPSHLLKLLLEWHSVKRFRHTPGLWVLQLRWSILAAASHRHKSWNPLDPPEFLSLPLLLHKSSMMEKEGSAYSGCKWQENEKKWRKRTYKEGICGSKTQPCCSSMFVDLLGLHLYLLPC